MGTQDHIDPDIERRAFIQLAKAKEKMINNIRQEFPFVINDGDNQDLTNRYIKMSYDGLLEEYRAIMQIVRNMERDK